MKFKLVKREVTGVYSREGVTAPVTRTESVSIPVLPRDWNVIALRGAIVTVLALTVAVIAWSTVKIGGLLHGGVGYVAAGIFDIGWLVAILLACLARYDDDKRKFADRLGWGMLAFTMVALFWAGWVEDSIPMAVVGAAVSAFAKVLWMGVMKHVQADLTSDDRQWMKHQESEAQSKAAVAQMRRRTARIEQRAALDLLAMEHEKRQVADAFGIPMDDATPVAPAIPRPAFSIEPPTLEDLGKAEAVRFVMRQLPESAGPEDVHSALRSGREDIDLPYVRQVIARDEAARTATEAEAVEAEVIELRK